MTTQASDNSRAALLMIGSMAFFAIEDLFLKSAAEALPPGQVLAINGIAGALVFWALAARRGERVFSREALRGMVLLRTLAEAGAAMLYIVALALVPLTLVSALLQASPWWWWRAPRSSCANAWAGGAGCRFLRALRACW